MRARQTKIVLRYLYRIDDLGQRVEKARAKSRDFLIDGG